MWREKLSLPKYRRDAQRLEKWLNSEINKAVKGNGLVKQEVESIRINAVADFNVLLELELIELARYKGTRKFDRYFVNNMMLSYRVFFDAERNKIAFTEEGHYISIIKSYSIARMECS